jgi:hypothetical protein
MTVDFVQEIYKLFHFIYLISFSYIHIITQSYLFVNSFRIKMLHKILTIFTKKIVQGVQMSQNPRVAPVHARLKRKSPQFGGKA